MSTNTSEVEVRQAAIKFFREQPQLETEDTRLLLAHTLTRYHQRKPRDRDPELLIKVARTLEVPNWMVIPETGDPPARLWENSSVMRQFLVVLKGHLDRRYVILEDGIESGQSGVSKVGAYAGEKVKVVRVEEDYNLTVQLSDGRRFRCHPGQFIKGSHRAREGQEAISPSTSTRRRSADPLELAKDIALRAKDSQAQVSMLRDIVETTPDLAILSRIGVIWSRSSLLREDTQAFMGHEVIRASIACGLYEEAARIASTLVPCEQFDAQIGLFNATGKASHLAHARKLARGMPFPDRPMRFVTLALVSKKASDSREAQKAIKELYVLDTESEPEALQRYRLREAQLLATFGKHDAARAILGSIADTDMRLELQSYITEITRDEDDIALLIHDTNDHATLSSRLIRSVAFAFISCGRGDLVRRLGEARKDALERSLLFAALAATDAGTDNDLREAERAFQLLSPDIQSTAALRLRLVEALSRRGRMGQAMRIVRDILEPRQRVHAYLTIHRFSNRQI